MSNHTSVVPWGSIRDDVKRLDLEVWKQPTISLFIYSQVVCSQQLISLAVAPWLL